MQTSIDYNSNKHTFTSSTNISQLITNPLLTPNIRETSMKKDNSVLLFPFLYTTFVNLT